LKEKKTIQHELVMKTKNENICGCYIENIISNNNNNKKDTSYSLASNGQLIINYDIITNQKIKNAIDIKLPGFTLKNRTSINRMIKSNESINYPEYSFCIMNKQKFIITVGYLSNAFQLYDISDKDKKYKFYIMEDFVRSICKTSEHVFLIGLNNGRLLEYEIQYKHNDTTFMSHKCKCKRFIYAHSSSICVIEYIPRLNIIITVGDDNYIYIRKYFNFELLSYISLDSKYKVLSLKVSDVNCVYVLVYDKTQSASANKMKVIGYTLTGIEFAESEYGMYTNMEITTSNNVILGIDETTTQSNSNDKKKMNHIMLLKGCSLERIGYMRLKSCEKKSVVYVKYYAKKRMLFYYFKDDIRVSQLEDGEKEIMVF
jgi:WD40 repeat protein